MDSLSTDVEEDVCLFMETKEFPRKSLALVEAKRVDSWLSKRRSRRVHHLDHLESITEGKTSNGIYFLNSQKYL